MYHYFTSLVSESVSHSYSLQQRGDVHPRITHCLQRCSMSCTTAFGINFFFTVFGNLKIRSPNFSLLFFVALE